MLFYRKACKVGISSLRLWVYKHGSFKMWFSWLWIFPPYINGRDKTVEKCTDRDIGMPSNKDSHPRLLQNQFSTFVNFFIKLHWSSVPLQKYSFLWYISPCDVYFLGWSSSNTRRLPIMVLRLSNLTSNVFKSSFKISILVLSEMPDQGSDRVHRLSIMAEGGSLLKTWPWVKLAPPVSVCLVVQAFDMKTCVCQACVSPIT